MAAPLAAKAREELRQAGARPNAPQYHDTPLLTVGKEVLVHARSGSCRPALIECINESDGTVDISYQDGEEEEDAVPVGALRPLHAAPAAASAGNAGGRQPPKQASAEERRRLGIRPNAPAYGDTPLLSVGKQVRVSRGELFRRATIECVNEAEGTIDVAYLPQEEVWPGAAPRRAEEEEEDTVPAESARPLEDFEVRREADWQDALRRDFYGTLSSLKEGANSLFKLRDYDAAVAYYSAAISELQDVEAAGLGRALLIQGGSFVLGTVRSFDARGRQAVVVTDAPGAGGQPTAQSFTLAARTLIAVHDGHLQLQGSLYMNRARSLAQQGRNREAAQDLSVVIGLWAACDDESERREQLLKAHCLRAKTRLARMRVGPAREDVAAAWALGPPEATAGLLRQLERDVAAAEKEKLRSNRRIAKEIAKFTDAAMSQMSGEQARALGQAA
ncbi:unnamed protein product [Prorocentrum cordatum]|uniref:Peptidylprolyl isomerase n=1 Tax=Prorocentrum cordatum TaxID=2364126 RepID=A0ABN9WEV3_9DINO|nr:unnamed protein product [Polarella glacialis]